MPEKNNSGGFLYDFVTVWGLRLFFHLAKRNIGAGRLPICIICVNGRETVCQIKPISMFLFCKGFFMCGSTTDFLSCDWLRKSFYWWNWPGIIVWGIGFRFLKLLSIIKLTVFKRHAEKGTLLPTTGLWSQWDIQIISGEVLSYGEFSWSVLNDNATSGMIWSQYTIVVIAYFRCPVLLEKKNKRGSPDIKRMRINSEFVPSIGKRDIYLEKSSRDYRLFFYVLGGWFFYDLV